jgi:hypothetical protein
MVLMATRIEMIFLIYLLLGCGVEPDGGGYKDAPVTGDTASSKKEINGGDKSEDSAPGDEAAESELLRDEGSARPSVQTADEAVLSKPDFQRPTPGEMIGIPGGTLKAGSPPQDRLRVDWAEMDMVQIEMTPFEIDAMPYPNDAERPFLTGITRSEAAQYCEEQGKRLCTELEWEWACKSGDARRYPSGNIYNPESYPESDRLLPASPFGVFAMGRLLEWTSSPWGSETDQLGRGAAKGYADGFEVSAIRGRRCATRWRRMLDGVSPSLGFRCCRGTENSAVVEIEPPRPPFSLYKTMKPEKFANIIRSIPELAAVHDNPHMYSDADIRTVLARRNSDREDLAKQGIHFRWKPMRWIPRQGMELWVAVGRSNAHGFVVALHEVKDNEEYAHASSLILWDQPAPLALVYRKGHRDELYWAPCWNCRDGGTVTFDDEKNEVIITHRW